MKRIMFFLYGIICYVSFLVTFTYAIGFISNILVPTSLDAAPQVPFMEALLINSGLLTLFALQHSIMARKGFKKWWTRYVPEPIERSTYVLLSNLCLVAMFVYWQPMGGTIWAIENASAQMFIHGLATFGWIVVFISTFLISHFDLFGLRQVWFYLRGEAYQPLAFNVPYFYKYVRHPLYFGFLTAFWATPMMTVAHFIFALACTGYILVAIQLEERDLTQHFGDHYTEYKKQVPMLVPKIKASGSSEAAAEA